MRGYAREVAFCKVYTYIMSGEFDEDFLEFDTEKLGEDVDFAKSLIEGVIADKESLDTEIAKLSKSFKLSRIYRIDLAILELAIWEIDHTETPYQVVINEAVGIAKKYSTEKSVSYVNGVLAAFVRGKDE